MKFRNTLRLFPLLLFVIFLFNVNASTHVNITLSEIVYQNVTFAQYFEFVENQTTFVVKGKITVNNPHNETVYDTKIYVKNTENMLGNFTWESGVPGYQITFRKLNYSVQELGEVNESWFNLTQDIDEDNFTDKVKVNSTHVIFNVSSLDEPIAIRLVNISGDPVDISNASGSPVDIYVNYTNLTDDDGTVFATIKINGTTNKNNTLIDSMTFMINDTARDIIILFIPELRQNQSCVFNYTINGSQKLHPPLDLDTNYTTPEYAHKVLAGHRFDILDKVTNKIDIGVNITNINITIMALSILWNQTDFNFTLQNLSETGDWTNVTNNTNKTWYWRVNGGTLQPGESANISYQVQAPYSVPSTAIYPAVKQILSYYIAYTASNLSIYKVRAHAKIIQNHTKHIIHPSDDEWNHNVTYESIPTLETPYNINYTITKVTLWVTSNLNPNNKTTLVKTYEVNSNLTNTSKWTGNPWHFNFTDGSKPWYPSPIIWMRPLYYMNTDYNQIINRSFTQNGTDVYVKYIYVINGYWLEISKNISNINNNSYRIHVWVHNKGNGWTPYNMTVTVYDIVPLNFEPYGWSISPNAYSNISGKYKGTAYKWDIGLKEPYYASLGPDDNAPGGLDEWNVTYYVNGTGKYEVSDLYIVGLDPRAVDGAYSSPLLTVISNIKSTSKETIFTLVAVFLTILNILNLVYVKRIHKEIQHKK